MHFQDKGLYGRVVHLQPVRWEGGWPLVGEDHGDDGVGRPVSRHRKPSVRKSPQVAIPQTRDDFSRDELGLQWQWHANPNGDWHSLTERAGHLLLRPQFVLKGNLKVAPNLLLQKFPAAEFIVETKLELTPDHPHLRAGLVVMGMEYAALEVSRASAGYEVRQVNSDEGGERLVITESAVILQVRVSQGGVCRFGVVPGSGGFYQIGPAFSAKAGKWIGAKVGIYCISADVLEVSGHADFDYFHFAPMHARTAEMKRQNASEAEIKIRKPERVVS
jgi:beta-xylosidase